MNHYEIPDDMCTVGLYLGGAHRRMTSLIGKRAERHTFICVSPAQDQWNAANSML